MSTIHMVGGEKGGVGKSVVARTVAQYLLDRPTPFAAVDADTSHGALLRYYGDYTRSVDLESFASADEIMDRALAAERRVLVDLPAQSRRLLQRWIAASDVLGFAREMSVKLVFWHVTDGGYDSVNELARLYETLGSNVEYVIVKNFGRSPEFTQLEQSEIGEQLQVEGASFVDFPQLDNATMYKIDRLGSSFWAAVNSKDEEWSLSPMERRRAQRWLKTSYEQLDNLGDRI